MPNQSSFLLIFAAPSGLKYVDQQDLPQGEERFVENPEAGVGLEEPEYRKRGDLVQAGARGAQRKLLSWKVGNMKTRPIFFCLEEVGLLFVRMDI